MRNHDEEIQQKISFEGRIVSVQVRSTVWRYLLDNRTHREIGYNLFLEGTVECDNSQDDPSSLENHSFSVAISEKQQEKLRFHIGDLIKGTAWTKKYPKWEYADYYRAGALKKTQPADSVSEQSSPWLSEVPDLETYAWRGARMLDGRCYKGKCFQCKWAAMANVTIEYNFGVSQKFRFESYCYGPKNCKFYKMGKPRSVTYKGMGTLYDEGWLDEICSENRGDDE